MKKILFIIGSLRAKSFNRQMANVAKEIIGNRAVVEELDYSDLPLLNQDIEQPEPAAVAWGTDVLVLTEEQKAQLKVQADKLV